MLIIDEGATTELIQALEGLSNSEDKYCIRLYPVAGVDMVEIQPQLVTKIQPHLPNADIYFGIEGEIFLLARDASVRACRKAMLDAAILLGVEPADNVGKLYDLGLETATLLILLEQRAQKEQKIQDGLQQQKASEQAASRRQQILELPKDANNIIARRKERKKPELMVIEDDAFSYRLVQNVLQKQYRLTWLSTAKNALSTYAELAPDILFLDINLPDVSGHELLEKIIALDPEAYVVMISGNADKTNVMEAMQRGAQGFVAKPFSRNKLFEYIERCKTITDKESK